MNSRRFVRRVLLAAAISSSSLTDLCLDAPGTVEAGIATPPRRSPGASSLLRLQPGTGRRTPADMTEPDAPATQSAQTAEPAPAAGQLQQAQYQPGGRGTGNQTAYAQSQQSGAAGNSTVTNELNRLFLENGQQPPSMREQDLPYANSPRMNMVQHKQQPQQQPPKKKNLFQKFVGRLKGDTDRTAETPEAAAGGNGLSPLSAPPPTAAMNSGKAPSAPQARAAAMMPPAVPPAVPPAPHAYGQPNAPQSGLLPAGRPQQGMAQNPAGLRQQRPMTQPPQGAAPGYSPAAGMPSQPYGQARPQMAEQSQPAAGYPGGRMAAAPAGSPYNQQPRQQNYVQPGPAPAFMQPSAAPPAANYSGAPQTTGGGQQPGLVRMADRPQSRQQPVQAAPVPPVTDDGFVDPFAASAAPVGADEELDLDSLIEIPTPMTESPEPAEQGGSTAAGSVGHPRSAQQTAAAATAPGLSLPANGQTQVQPGTVSPGQFAADAVESAAAAAPENPFTGVQLDMSDDEFFEDTAGRVALPEVTDSDALSTDLPPVEEFETNLPALEIPAAVEDFEEPQSNRVPLPRPTPAAEPAAAPPAAIRKPQVPARTISASSELPPDRAVPSPSSQGEAAALQQERLQQAADQSRRERQRTQIQSRSGQTGFKGFCPVELRDRRELVDANTDITATFGLQTYSFSSAQAKAAFEADPSRYAPAAGGSDVVLLINSGEEQPGLLDYSLWYRDRLYMFRSRESMAQFSRDPARYANQY